MTATLYGTGYAIWNGIWIVIEGDGLADMGGRRKQRHGCNGRDRCECTNVKACRLPTGEHCRNNSRKLKDT